MFNEIKGSNKPFPYQTFTIMLCAIGVTFGTVFIFTNFTMVFGSFRTDLNPVQYLSLIFQHGYDAKSGILHLTGCLIIFIFMGGTLEKIIDPNRFMILNLGIILIYGTAHKLFGLIGHGLTPVLFAYTPLIAYSLYEGRLIKTRSMYDEYYKTLWALILIVLIVIPVLLSIIPIYFDSHSNLTEQIYKGNILHLVLLLAGLGFTQLFKEHARHRLLYFAKKKKFPPHYKERLSPFLAFVYPGILLLVFILLK